MTQKIKFPSIFIHSLLVKQEPDHTVYFQKFHNGINVLYGANGGGKTSIIQLLVYILGYDVSNWVDEVLLCDVAYAEVELNGQILTFRRKINNKVQQSLFISFDNLNNSLEKNIDSWVEYPYSISKHKESFSQKIFNILDIPENKVDNDVNMTLHQLLRFVYKKQSDSSTYILNHEEWDSSLKREAIQDYLLGFYDNELYEARIKLKAYEKDVAKYTSEINSIETILVNSDIDVKTTSLTEFCEVIENGNNLIYEEIKKIKELEITDFKSQNNDIKELTEENLLIKNKLHIGVENLSNLDMEIEDNTMFISELENKVNSIKDSIKLKNLTSNLIEFEVCPSCFSKVTKKNVNNCSLCNSEKPSSSIEINLLKMKNELEIQLSESKTILQKKKEAYTKLIDTNKTIESKLKNNTKKLNILMASIDITRDKKLYELFSKIGMNEEKIETFRKLEKLSLKIQELVNKRNEANNFVAKCKDIIASRENLIQSRKDSVNQTIFRYMRDLLKEDISEKDDFQNIIKVTFDFAMNEISINSKNVFSESSMFLINNMLHFAILLASFKHDFIRVPKLLILDGIENGGMSEKRSKNFQRILKKHTENLNYKYQIFITTRSIADELSSPEFIIGDELTETNKSLKIIS